MLRLVDFMKLSFDEIGFLLSIICTIVCFLPVYFLPTTADSTRTTGGHHDIDRNTLLYFFADNEDSYPSIKANAIESDQVRILAVVSFSVVIPSLINVIGELWQRLFARLAGRNAGTINQQDVEKSISGMTRVGRMIFLMGAAMSSIFVFRSEVKTVTASGGYNYNRFTPSPTILTACIASSAVLSACPLLLGLHHALVEAQPRYRKSSAVVTVVAIMCLNACSVLYSTSAASTAVRWSGQTVQERQVFSKNLSQAAASFGLVAIVAAVFNATRRGRWRFPWESDGELSFSSRGSGGMKHGTQTGKGDQQKSSTDGVTHRQGYVASLLLATLVCKTTFLIVSTVRVAVYNGAFDIQYKVMSQFYNYEMLMIHFPLSIVGSLLMTVLQQHIRDMEINRSLEALESKRSFVRYISHEIRTPLSAVSMGLELLEEELATDSSPLARGYSDCVTQLRSATGVAVDILNDLLQYDKIKDDNLQVYPAPHAAVQLVNEAVGTFALQARKSGVALVLSYVPAAPPITGPLSGYSSVVASGRSGGGGARRSSLNSPLSAKDMQQNELLLSQAFIDVDKPRILQVIRNLVSNALKFTPKGGNVTISINFANKLGPKKGEDSSWVKNSIGGIGNGFGAGFNSDDGLGGGAGSSSNNNSNSNNNNKGRRRISSFLRSLTNIKTNNNTVGAGYDNTRNQQGGSERNQSSAPASIAPPPAYNHIRSSSSAESGIPSVMASLVPTSSLIPPVAVTQHAAGGAAMRSKNASACASPPPGEKVSIMAAPQTPTSNDQAGGIGGTATTRGRAVSSPVSPRASPSRGPLFVSNIIMSAGRSRPRTKVLAEDDQTMTTLPKYLIIEVTDTGPGIEKENLGKVFNEIVQFNPNELQGGGGSGLGLVISRGIVLAHKGGKIWLTSEGAGKGCTFAFGLPVTFLSGSEAGAASAIHSGRSRIARTISRLFRPPPSARVSVLNLSNGSASRGGRGSAPHGAPSSGLADPDAPNSGALSALASSPRSSMVMQAGGWVSSVAASGFNSTINSRKPSASNLQGVVAAAAAAAAAAGGGGGTSTAGSRLGLGFPENNTSSNNMSSKLASKLRRNSNRPAVSRGDSMKQLNRGSGRGGFLLHGGAVAQIDGGGTGSHRSVGSERAASVRSINDSHNHGVGGGDRGDPNKMQQLQHQPAVTRLSMSRSSFRRRGTIEEEGEFKSDEGISLVSSVSRRSIISIMQQQQLVTSSDTNSNSRSLGGGGGVGGGRGGGRGGGTAAVQERSRGSIDDVITDPPLSEGTGGTNLARSVSTRPLIGESSAGGERGVGGGGGGGGGGEGGAPIATRSFFSTISSSVVLLEPTEQRGAGQANGGAISTTVFFGLHALVVDDSSINRHMLCRALATIGCTSAEAEDGQIAVEMVAQSLQSSIREVASGGGNSRPGSRALSRCASLREEQLSSSQQAAGSSRPGSRSVSRPLSRRVSFSGMDSPKPIVSPRVALLGAALHHHRQLLHYHGTSSNNTSLRIAAVKKANSSASRKGSGMSLLEAGTGPSPGPCLGGSSSGMLGVGSPVASSPAAGRLANIRSNHNNHSKKHLRSATALAEEVRSQLQHKTPEYALAASQTSSTNRYGRRSTAYVRPYDFILCDNVMPRMDGPTAVQKIREMGYTCPIFGVTGNVLVADVEEFIQHGANTVLGKPLKLATLKQAIQTYVLALQEEQQQYQY